MKIAVTNHAVVRYKERVQGAEDMEDETVRDVVREKILAGFKDGLVRDHPTEKERRIIPFKAGQDILYFSVGPNKSATIAADLAVIGVLYDKELGGKVSTGVTLEDVAPSIKSLAIQPRRPPQFVVQIGEGVESVEVYKAEDLTELQSLLQRRQPDPEQVLIYELSDLEVSTKYIVERKRNSK